MLKVSDDMDWNYFYDLCLSIGTTPENVAQELNIHPDALVHWRQSGTMDSKIIISTLSDYFGLSEVCLLGLSKEPEEKKINASADRRDALIDKVRDLTDVQVEKLLVLVDALFSDAE